MRGNNFYVLLVILNTVLRVSAVIRVPNVLYGILDETSNVLNTVLDTNSGILGILDGTTSVLNPLLDLNAVPDGRNGILEETTSILGPRFKEIGESLDQLVDDTLGGITNGALPVTFKVATTLLNEVAQGLQHLVPMFPQNSNVEDGDWFDYVVVGGGTAGCIVANRLTEDANVTVLLIEAGDDPNVFAVVPGLFPLQVFSETDWQYETVDDGVVSQSLNGNSAIMHVGKHLGGGSSSSYSVYIRGKEATYESWNVEGWDYDSNLPYFTKLENVDYTPLSANELRSIHGTEGPVNLTTHEGTAFDYIENIFLDSFEKLGYDIIPDINDRSSLGFAKPLLQVSRDGKRSSTALTYLLPISDRNNLYLLKNTVATRLLFDSDGITVIGVEYKTKDGDLKVVYARREVILTAGPYETPKILMLSGVGPADHLQEMGIPVRVDSPVGLTYRDMPTPILPITGTLGVTAVLQNVVDVINLNTFPLGLVAGSVSIEENDKPQILIVPLSFPAVSAILPIGAAIDFNVDVNYVLRIITQNVLNDIVTPFVTLTDIDSYGYVKLRSTDPSDPPVIYNGYYANRTDLAKAIKGIKLAAELQNVPEFQRANSQIITFPNCDDKEYGTDEYYECMTLESTGSLFLGFGSCPLGSVLDSQLRVQGISRVRVLDSSAIPSLLGAWPQAVTMMIAEKGSDMIKADNLT